MTIRPLLSVLAAAILTSVSAHAAEPFIGINIETPGETYGNYGPGYEHVKNFNSPTSWKIDGGLKLDNHYSIEAGYVHGGNWKSVSPVPGAAQNVTNLSSSTFYVAAKGSMPVSDAFSVFGKLGLASNKDELSGAAVTADSRTSVRPMVGFGGEYALAKNVALVLEYEYFGKTTTSWGPITHQKVGAGVQFHF